VNPFGKRVATFVAACMALDLYGYAVYHAWRTHYIGSVTTLVLLTLIAGLGIGGLLLAPKWLEQAKGAASPTSAPAAPPAPESVAPRRPWWLPWLLGLGSIAAGFGIAEWGRIVLPAAPSTLGEWLGVVALDAACVGFSVFTVIRLRRPSAFRPIARQFGLALGVIFTIEGAFQVVGGLSIAHVFSVQFLFALVQMAVIDVPLFLWAGYVWSRVMSAIFTPPKR
jgi:hypothetical protein